MIITIEGKPASGKTTTCIKLIEKIKEKGKHYLCGFTTKEIRDHTGKRTGFEIITLQGRRAILADVIYKTPFRVGKYYVKVDNFEKIALDEVGKFFKGECNILIIDEIGKMEMLSKKFREFIEKLISVEKGIIVCTLPVVDFHPLVSAFKQRADKRFLLESGSYKSEEVAEEVLQIVLKKPLQNQST